MAPRTRIVKLGALLLSQFGLLATLNFQRFWMVAAYKMMELKRKLSLTAYLSARKTYLQRKIRYRIYSNKRRGAYLIFRATSAALIRGRRLFEGSAYLKIVPDKFNFSIYLFNGTLSIC